jgi:hypothetical protein
MRRLAFFAPMKPPGHPVPSGDRAMARALIRALEWNGAARVDLASETQLRDGAGCREAQDRLFAQAHAETGGLIDRYRADPPDAWITYHNYYKAPDLIGPAVCAALDIPYVQVESSRARSRLAGPWARFAAAAEAATDAAALVFYMTTADAEALTRDRPVPQRLAHLRPFLDRTDLPAQAALDGPILTAAMMRSGDKLASYRIIAETLALLKTPGWRIEIVGDGPARAEVETALAPFGDRIRWTGRLDGDALAARYGAASVFFWPGVNEAYGMVYLEAQAHGLPVVAQDRPGLRDVVTMQQLTPPEGGAADLARRIDTLLADGHQRAREGAAGRDAVARNHLMPQAAATLHAALDRLLDGTP